MSGIPSLPGIEITSAPPACSTASALWTGAPPDLDRHLARLNRSAKTTWLKPTMGVEGMTELAREA